MTVYAIVESDMFDTATGEIKSKRCDAYPNETTESAREFLIHKFGDLAEWECPGIKIIGDIETDDLVTVEYRFQYSENHPKNGLLFEIQRYRISDTAPF